MSFFRVGFTNTSNLAEFFLDRIHGHQHLSDLFSWRNLSLSGGIDNRYYQFALNSFETTGMTRFHPNLEWPFPPNIKKVQFPFPPNYPLQGSRLTAGPTSRGLIIVLFRKLVSLS